MVRLLHRANLTCEVLEINVSTSEPSLPGIDIERLTSMYDPMA